MYSRRMPTWASFAQSRTKRNCIPCKLYGLCSYTTRINVRSCRFTSDANLTLYVKLTPDELKTWYSVFTKKRAPSDFGRRPFRNLSLFITTFGYMRRSCPADASWYKLNLCFYCSSDWRTIRNRFHHFGKCWKSSPLCVNNLLQRIASLGTHETKQISRACPIVSIRVERFHLVPLKA